MLATPTTLSYFIGEEEEEEEKEKQKKNKERVAFTIYRALVRYFQVLRQDSRAITLRKDFFYTTTTIIATKRFLRIRYLV